MAQKKNPVGVITGQKKEAEANFHKKTLTLFFFGTQGGSCPTCAYFGMKMRKYGLARRFCRFTGEVLGKYGNPLCEFRHVKGGKA